MPHDSYPPADSLNLWETKGGKAPCLKTVVPSLRDAQGWKARPPPSVRGWNFCSAKTANKWGGTPNPQGRFASL